MNLMVIVKKHKVNRPLVVFSRIFGEVLVFPMS